MKNKRNNILSWVFLLLWMGLIFYFSSRPAVESKELSEGILEIFINRLEYIVPDGLGEDLSSNLHFLIRKGAHFFVYFVLGILAVNSLKTSGVEARNRIVFALIFCILYAISDEFHQTFVDGRSGEVRDVLIDSFGSIGGIWSYEKVSNKLNERRKYS